MKKKTLKSSVLAVALAASMMLVGCGDTNPQGSGGASTGSTPGSSTPAGSTPGSSAAEPTAEPVPELVYAPGTELRVSIGYNSKKTGISFDSETAGEGIKLADGKTYHTGDLKPTWVEMENVLNVKFVDVYQGNNGDKEWAYWKEKLGDIDFVKGGAKDLSAAGEAGLVVDLNKYMDQMPNFKKYLEDNSIVRLSITGNTDTGAIYFAPYFDGVNDIERMPLMRTDWVVALLDGEGEFKAEKSGTTAAPVYQPYMPTSGKVTVDVVKPDGKSTETVTKDYDKAGNIVAKMNAKGSMTGVEAVNMLRKYIDEAYNNYYGTKRSDLFCGQNAAWDADEMVALLRCVVANSATLSPNLTGTKMAEVTVIGEDGKPVKVKNAEGKEVNKTEMKEVPLTVQGLFSREDNNTQRRVDLYKFAGHLFGVRGLEGRSDYLFLDKDGKLHDARQEVATYEALSRMHDMALEGLISQSFIDNSKESSSTMLQNDMGFMSYDYNQTQTVLNATLLQNDEGEKYMAVMVPVARWNDGTGEKFMRFTESWRSVKTDGMAISVAGVGNDTNKLNALLKLIDYCFSEEGQLLQSYGPEAFRSKETFSFNGKEMPKISDATYEDLYKLAKGNYTNFARYYLGSTIHFVKSQAFEYQCTHEIGKEGAGYISNAIGLGTIKHPELALTDNPWYTSIPTVIPHTTSEQSALDGYTELGNKNFGTSNGQRHIFVDVISKGFTGQGLGSAAEAAKTVSDSWMGKQYLQYKQIGWEYLTDYYKSINK